MTINNFFKASLFVLACASSSYASNVDSEELDPTGRSIYEAMGNWDLENSCPKKYDFDGTGVGIALIEGSHAYIGAHPALGRSDIIIDGIDLRRDAERGHALQMAALISGYVEEPQKSSNIKHSSTYYYGGNAPGAKVYAYAVDVEGKHSPEKLLETFLQVESRGDEIDIIHLSRAIVVTPEIIEVMNRLAEQNKIFVQSSGNRREENREMIQYTNDSHPSDFSDLFRNHMMRVGALTCPSDSPIKMWKKNLQQGSGYFDNDALTSKNRFIFAPGNRIGTAGPDRTYMEIAGTSPAATFVTSLLAMGLQRCDKDIDRGDLLDLLCNNHIDLQTNSGKIKDFYRLDYTSFFNNLTWYFEGTGDIHVNSSSLYQGDYPDDYLYDFPIISSDFDHEILNLEITDAPTGVCLKLNNYPILFGQNPEYSANVKETLLEIAYRLFKIIQVEDSEVDLSQGLNLDSEVILARTINRLSDGTLYKDHKDYKRAQRSAQRGITRYRNQEE